MIFKSRRTATASMRPLPQIERGSMLPMMSKSRSLSFIMTASMAPAAALLPEEIPAPSRAGPAAQLAANKLPLSARMISPFVPMSMTKEVCFSFSMSTARATALMSEPTKPAMFGGV